MSAVALGNFDGLHLGHQSVLKAALSYGEQGYTPTVVLFDIHPKEYFSGEKVMRLMTPKSTKSELNKMGFEVYVLKFAYVCNMSPEEFFKKVIIEKLNAGAVCCGFNYSFGKNGLGKSEDLKMLCKNQGIFCNISSEIKISEKTVSSTQIREYLENGETENAKKMLTRPFFFESEVIHGDSRGHTLGFPTVNQQIPECLVMPKFGVYETAVTIDGKKYKGVTNIGKRPTYLLSTALSETNILDFHNDVYGKIVKIEFVRYLRNEKKFNSTQELISAVSEDAKRVRDGV